ncbi:MAG: ABC transporter permease subunit [Clostridiales bacterium]|nr:ABC transporter permease subunit [Clostridiales bacterium]
MRIFTIAQNNKKNKISFKAVVFWIVLWQIASMIISKEILLVSPISALKKLAELAVTFEFWKVIFFSFTRIFIGFFLAVIISVIFAIFSSKYKLFRDLIYPPILVMQSVPVASFIILCLIWISTKNLSIFISFIMVFPIIYTNILQGIEETDVELLEMAKVFNISSIKKIRYIYLWQVIPYFKSSCNVSLGLAFKAGIAAEVIGIPKGSIGERLYESKIYLNTDELFAWTILIVILSIILKKLFIFLLNYILKYMERS